MKRYGEVEVDYGENEWKMHSAADSDLDAEAEKEISAAEAADAAVAAEAVEKTEETQKYGEVAIIE
jgi:anti-sigma factor RsiW